MEGGEACAASYVPALYINGVVDRGEDWQNKAERARQGHENMQRAEYVMRLFMGTRGGPFKKVSVLGTGLRAQKYHKIEGIHWKLRSDGAGHI